MKGERKPQEYYRLWWQVSRLIWSDERKIPRKLIMLLDWPNLLEELRTAILQACAEVQTQGAVTYPTKARIEHYLHTWLLSLDELEVKRLEDMWNREVK